MTELEAIEVIKNNWPDERYTGLKIALTMAIDALSDEWRLPDAYTPVGTPYWYDYIIEDGPKKGKRHGWALLRWGDIVYREKTVFIVLAKESQGPPPDDYRPKEKQE